MKFFVNVRYNTCQPVPLEVDRIATILTLKEKIGTRYQLPVDEIRVIFQGRELSDNATFEVRNQFTAWTALIFLRFEPEFSRLRLCCSSHCATVLCLSN